MKRPGPCWIQAAIKQQNTTSGMNLMSVNRKGMFFLRALPSIISEKNSINKSTL
jgi:hypothetical protein